MKRETEKRIEIKDAEGTARQFLIKKFDALTGSYIAYKVMSQMVPMVGALDTKAPIQKQIAKLSMGLMQSQSSMTKEEFVSLQRDCLGVCFEIQKAKSLETPVAVMLANGSWGVPDLEHDTMTVIALTIHSLFFNVAGFFGENAPNLEGQVPEDSFHQPGAKT